MSSYQLLWGTYCKCYGIQHALIRILEGWRANLDQNKIIGAVLLDLFKYSDCITHDLLIAKLNA